VLTVKPLSKRKSLPWQILSIRFQRTKLRVALPIVHRYTRNGILTPDFSLSALQISISHSLQARCRTHGSVARTTQQETIKMIGSNTSLFLIRRLLAVSLITMLVGCGVVRIASAHLAFFNKNLCSVLIIVLVSTCNVFLQ
jgi:hypothetical protein